MLQHVTKHVFDEQQGGCIKRAIGGKSLGVINLVNDRYNLENRPRVWWEQLRRHNACDSYQRTVDRFAEKTVFFRFYMHFTAN